MVPAVDIPCTTAVKLLVMVEQLAQAHLTFLASLAHHLHLEVTPQVHQQMRI